jgi:hypothetical protein
MRYSISLAFAIAITAIVAYLGVIDTLTPADCKAAAGLVAQIAATFAGFLLTVLSILATITQTVLVKNMQKTGHFRVLLRRLFINVATFVVVAVTGVVAAFMTSPPIGLMYGLMFFSALGAMVLIDVLSKFWMVLEHLNPNAGP